VPDEARYRWADALVLEQRFLLGPLMSGPLTKPEDVRKAYDAAIARADDDLRAEIELHLVSRFVTANFANEALGPIVDEARREGARTALARTAVAERLTGDPFLVYVCRFFRARIHDRLNERPEAEAAYRSALEVYPGAHSASLPLAALLFLRGEETTARLLVNNALAASGTEDPGRAYFLQDYWRLPKYIEQMRAALGRGGR
jgi:tetratricopeptide (TPR) repeat protein